jgi:hypothetical protein
MTEKVCNIVSDKEEDYNTKVLIYELTLITGLSTKGKIVQLLWRAVCL